MKKKELPGIRETTRDFDGIEREIIKMFRRDIYLPLLKELRAPAVLKNAVSDLDKLISQISSGKLRFWQGKFHGKFEAATSKALRKLGAVWDDGAYAITSARLPYELRSAIQSAEYRFDRALEAIDKKLAGLLPPDLAHTIRIADYFDSTLYRLDKDFEAQVKGITVVPKLTRETRAAVAAGYTKDLQKYISDFTQKQIGELRRDIRDSTLEGNRYETMVGKIQKSYGVSQRKAKFLARQETALMMASFKKARYQEAGIAMYRWQTVIGSPKHPVRDSHKACSGKFFTWDSPVEVDANGKPKPGGARKPGSNLNPGEDYNCRCIGRPVVHF